MLGGLLGVGFIFLVSFVLYRIIRLAVDLADRILQVAKRNRESGRKRESQPKVFTEAPLLYSIGQNEFTRIVNKVAYRHPRVENVDINGNTASIEFSSQTGLSRNRATFIFSLSGLAVGDYLLQSDNPDSSLPAKIGDKIWDEIKRNAELNERTTKGRIRFRY